MLLSLAAAAPAGPALAPYAPDGVTSLTLHTPTQVAFHRGLAIIADLGHSQFLYRPEESREPWRVSPVPVYQQHSLALGADGLYYAADTDHHRLLAFADLDHDAATSATTIAGQPLTRPHDVLLDPATGWLYVIDGNRRLYRLRGLGRDESFIQFSPKEMDYARALSLIDGKVHIINSNHGQVIRVDDFDRHQWTVFRSPGKREIAPAGAWDKTGLVLNDVEFFHGYYYGANFFTAKYAPGHDANRDRLIRWKTWDDFENGRWDDLSAQLPAGLVPYYFTVHGDRLYLAAFDGEKPGEGRDQIFVMTE